MSESANLEARIQQLEARLEIDALIARYCAAMDERNFAEIVTIFTPDIVIKSADGVMNSSGIDDVMKMWRERFAVLGPSNHFTHDRLISFDAGDPDLARGLVNSHAEMSRNGTAMLAAIRYDDVYQRLNQRWRFKQRSLSFFYYLSAAEYAEALGQDPSMRMRAYGDKRAADWPEALESWKTCYGD